MEEVSVVHFDTTATTIYTSWIEGNEQRVLVGLRDRLVIVGLDGVYWTSPPLEGALSVATRIDFGDAGAEILLAAYSDSLGWLMEYFGDGFQETREYPTGRLTGEGLDTRGISSIIGLPNYNNDEKPILIGQRSQTEFSGSGSLIEIELTTGEQRTLLDGIGCVTDYEWVTLPDENFPRLSIGLGSYQYFDRPYYAWFSRNEIWLLDSVFANPTAYQVYNYSFMGPVIACEYFIHEAGNAADSGPIVLGFGDNATPVFTIYRLVWASQRPVGLLNLDISAATGRAYSPLYYREQGQNGREFELLLTWGDHSGLMVIDLESLSVCATYDFPSGAIQNTLVPASGDGGQILATLFQDRIVFSQIGVLDVKETTPSAWPTSFSLSSPFPNPFNSSTTISFTLPKPGRYALDVVDISGRLVARLSDGWKEAGSYREVWDGGGVGSGVYYVKVGTGAVSASQPVTLIR